MDSGLCGTGLLFRKYPRPSALQRPKRPLPLGAGPAGARALALQLKDARTAAGSGHVRARRFASVA